jgi:hypothetical protein
MQIIINNTSKIVTLAGIPARVWEGETNSGIPVICFIPRIVVISTQDLRQFETELLDQQTPSPEAETIPRRLVL